ncbi:hypothetical protein DICVIV_04408 [Dictyocaulus viviparus]|uniref:Uncharacterized protein n=1 Tax=Dictyocaulus viviparus TaxID=29172 RepID=A0A0D8Y4H7_DICVI|nr:hypothetical protein DICVIV_04408 [Dictyocaulus viviparus]
MIPCFLAPPTPQFYHHVTTAQHASMAMRPSAPGAVMAWPTAPPVGPKYRPPSPLRDYKNPVAVFSKIVRKVRKHILSSEEGQKSEIGETERSAAHGKTVVMEESTVKSQMTQMHSVKSVTRSPDESKITSGKSPDSRITAENSATEKKDTSVCESVMRRKPSHSKGRKDK